ncbi:glucose/arabinose dehydrogenase [Cellulosimicrobium cellulans]|uniref:PQQ-dependent sugar dehydrogenase n=1 Tax=Cellulosimicrobium cellulans TaxID=1710 RepID=UPI00195EAD52|nr:PQQ-dependent sugar dehydrogenase [Cellulosimicrobium cellulans]MBM7821063.1 glucose/arabinose dehydrogenase [Cellulosimicrobium cellulans]
MPAHPSTARRWWPAVVVGAAVVLLAACTPDDGPEPAPGPSVTTAAPGTGEPTATGGSVETTTPAPGPGLVVVPEVRVDVTEVATGLPAPWGLAALADGTLLVSLRDERGLVVVDPASGAAEPVTGAGADDLRDGTVATGESGLLGVAVGPEGSAAPGEVFVYRTADGGNEVLRGTLAGRELSALAPILQGVPAASTHDGGRLAFGPDGYLYVTTGDAQQRGAAQVAGALNGKILRLTVDGAPAPGNPDPASPVWSLGHRNVQGVAWDVTGRMLASEFGQDTFDELNVVVPGGNYGWPEVEGVGGAVSGFVDPVATWSTSDASPSGLAVTREGAYLAGLRGQTLWRVPFATPDAGGSADAFGPPQALLTDRGRLRAVLVDPATPLGDDGSSVLYVLTNNTDGRGDPRAGDDRLLRVVVAPAG